MIICYKQRTSAHPSWVEATKSSTTSGPNNDSSPFGIISNRAFKFGNVLAFIIIHKYVDASTLLERSNGIVSTETHF